MNDVQISIVIPTLNESAHIESLFHSIQAIDSTTKEIIFVDGGSNDGTQDTVRRLMETHSNVVLLDNPDRYVSQAFNRAYAIAQGKYLSLIGAHALYPQHYFSTCIEQLESGTCEVAGGFLLHRGQGLTGQAIAHGMSSRFGVGNTSFRTDPVKKYVDSVAFAVYDRSIFEQVGLFDEELVRNQDDEFHYRLNRVGMRILLLPELQPVYFVRNSFGALFRQYFQYGFYKPLVFRKVPGSTRRRHLIPAAFVLYLFSLPLGLAWPLWFLPLTVYSGLAGYFAFDKKHSTAVALRAMVVFPTLHIAYGSGFLSGIWHWNTRK
jgi:glycosyltransferase involved in cell wall biosynthesis